MFFGVGRGFAHLSSLYFYLGSLLGTLLQSYAPNSPRFRSTTNLNIYLGNELTLAGKQQNVSEPEGKPVEQQEPLC